MSDEAFQVTDQGAKKIKVILNDRLNNQQRTDEVKRSFLARMFHENKVVGCSKGLYIIEVDERLYATQH